MGIEKIYYEKNRVYDSSEIQKVYHQHHYYNGTVLYSSDKGVTWQSVGMDPGKWDIHNWIFAFIKEASYK